MASDGDRESLYAEVLASLQRIEEAKRRREAVAEARGGERLERLHRELEDARQVLERLRAPATPPPAPRGRFAERALVAGWLALFAAIGAAGGWVIAVGRPPEPQQMVLSLPETVARSPRLQAEAGGAALAPRTEAPVARPRPGAEATAPAMPPSPPRVGVRGLARTGPTASAPPLAPADAGGRLAPATGRAALAARSQAPVVQAPAGAEAVAALPTAEPAEDSPLSTVAALAAAARTAEPAPSARPRRPEPRPLAQAASTASAPLEPGAAGRSLAPASGGVPGRPLPAEGKLAAASGRAGTAAVRTWSRDEPPEPLAASSGAGAVPASPLAQSWGSESTAGVRSPATALRPVAVAGDAGAIAPPRGTPLRAVAEPRALAMVPGPTAAADLAPMPAPPAGPRLMPALASGAGAAVAPAPVVNGERPLVARRPAADGAAPRPVARMRLTARAAGKASAPAAWLRPIRVSVAPSSLRPTAAQPGPMGGPEGPPTALASLRGGAAGRAEAPLHSQRPASRVLHGRRAAEISALRPALVRLADGGAPGRGAVPRLAGHYAWLGSMRTTRGAGRLADELLARFPRELAGLTWTFKRIELEEKGRWYRLLAGAFDERKRARRLCRRVKAADAEAFCLPEQVEGDS